MVRQFKWTAIAVVCLACCSMANPASPVNLKAADRFSPAEAGAVQLEGWIGNKLNLCMQNRVMAQDIEKIIKPFRQRFEKSSGDWRCEYWGKWFTSVALGYAYQPTQSHRAVLDRAVEALLATQTADGYIGTYHPEYHLGTWDVWGRKYTLLGLIAYYDLTTDKAVLNAACRAADHLLKEAPPGEFNFGENGIDVLKGLSSNSILEPVALLYQRTGEKRYLELAEDIIANWSKPNKYMPHGLRLIEQALEGTPPARIASSKAYEMMSCFEGLCEMYRITGEQKYLDASVKFAQSIRRNERMVHGSGSNKELWCGGTRYQTEILEQPTETCVTTTWMKLCNQLLRLTGDPVWADELEISLYNALVSAMMPPGDWWAYWSPLAGQRVPSHFQHDDVQLSCCVANGPRGLLLTPRWAVMRTHDGLVVNLYCPGRAVHKLPNGMKVTLLQQTDYPVGDQITLTVSPEKTANFPLYLRIPQWSKDTSLTVNGNPVAATAGTYASTKRDWSPGDEVVLKLDMRGRAIPAPSGAPDVAVMRGPILLALDSRLQESRDLDVRIAADDRGYVDLQPCKSKPDGVWMAFEVPFWVRPTHYFEHHRIMLSMCDYASAGNEWSSQNLFRVWLPQPLFMRHMYPAGTWRIMYRRADESPTKPI